MRKVHSYLFCAELTGKRAVQRGLEATGVIKNSMVIYNTERPYSSLGGLSSFDPYWRK
jgi:hypothetical protein